MKHFTKSILLSFTVFFSSYPVHAIENPQALAAALSSAIAAKDMNSASKLVEWGQAPVAAYRIFKMSIADCFGPATCKVAVVKMTEEEKNPQTDYKFAVIPEGQLKIISSEPGDGGFSMPFAKVGNAYKIILGQQTEGAYAQARSAADSNKIAQGLDADLVSTGKPLPIDGGELAAAYREYLAAIARKDTSFLAQHGTEGDRYFFGTAYKNNPVKAEVALELAALENIIEPKIKGGFIKDDRAILLVSGSSGQGWTTEGAVTLKRDSGKWLVEDKSYLSYPPAHG